MKLLALPGYRSNSKLHRFQVELLELDDKIEIVYLDSPHKTCVPCDKRIVEVFPPPYFYWADDDKPDALKSSVKYLVNHLKKRGPYDGLIGFSQGAAMATYLTYLHEQKEIKLSKKLWKFVILLYR
eukprot:UN04113